MNKSLQQVKAYYDVHVAGKLEGFIEGNERVERAWLTIDQWTLANPRSILEIGCGIGDICWRMTRRWQEAEVVGLDVSLQSLRIAQQLFGSPKLSFCEGPLVKGKLVGKFDLIILMDVYEHIAVKDRPRLHEALADQLSDRSRVFLSFPTPRHQVWLRQYHPDQIQPVDEDVSIDTISALARDTKTEVLLYQEVGVWHEGDYAHAVLGKRGGWIPVSKAHPRNQRIRKRISKLLRGRPEPLVPPRSRRLALVRQQLGPEYYPG